MSTSARRSPANGGTVALFYDGLELTATESPLLRLPRLLRCYARHVYRTARRTQIYTGFYTGFRNLVASLRDFGLDVRVNDFAFARLNPHHPITLCGFPSVLERVVLPNPAMFVFGDFGTPPDAKRLVRKTNIRIFTQPCEWICDLYRSELGSAVRPLPVGIDTARWSPPPAGQRATDFLVYDKIRWNRSDREQDLLEPALHFLASKGLTYKVLRYGQHHINDFHNALMHCRSLLFLCEHETQGLAYQEAMSAGLPVLAWDEGVLLDPLQSKFLELGTTVSSVPYFDERCGMTFKIGTFERSCRSFLDALPTFAPRAYVEQQLSFRACAERFMALHDELFLLA